MVPVPREPVIRVALLTPTKSVSRSMRMGPWPLDHAGGAPVAAAAVEALRRCS
jgi:hypothetical protein